MLTAEFKQHGYLRIANAFSEKEMDAASTQVRSLIESKPDPENILIENNQPKKLLYMFDKGVYFLQLLVLTPILEILATYIDDPTQVVPTWEDMIIKLPFSRTGFKPHQDLPMQSLKYDIFTIAIYLTPSVDVPVSFLPGSHLFGALTRNQLAEICQREKHHFVSVPANKGDIIIHNAKTIHYSQDNHTDLPRYTWYLEFRTINQLRQDSPWDEQWILKRRAIFVYALMKFKPNLVDKLAPDAEVMKLYLNNIQLKVPHVTNTVNYDMTSPYYHF